MHDEGRQAKAAQLVNHEDEMQINQNRTQKNSIRRAGEVIKKWTSIRQPESGKASTSYPWPTDWCEYGNTCGREASWIDRERRRQFCSLLIGTIHVIILGATGEVRQKGLFAP